MWSKCHHLSHQDRHKSQYQSKRLWVEFPIYLISLKYYSDHSPLYRMVLGEAEQSKSQFISDNFSTWRKYITVIISGIAYCLLKINFILPFCPIQELSKVSYYKRGTDVGSRMFLFVFFWSYNCQCLKCVDMNQKQLELQSAKWET